MAEVIFHNNKAMSRYEAKIGRETAGFIDYTLRDNVISLNHTEIDKAFEGYGVGSTLVRGALDDIREDGSRTVLPLCPFVKGWIDRHADYRDLLEPREDDDD